MPLLLVLLALGAPATVEVSVLDPNGGAVHDYRGVPLVSLLPSAPSGNAALVRCEDGFVVLLSLDVIRRYGPVVASEVRDARGFEPIPPPRGPRYLVWPNRAMPEIDRDPAVTSEGWAWAVDSIEVVVSSEYLAPLKPARDDGKLQRGRALWFNSCFHCHALRGAGGLAGWDLAEPVPLWQYRSEPEVARYLRDPRAVNPNGHMPAQRLSPTELRDLFAYLHAVMP